MCLKTFKKTNSNNFENWDKWVSFVNQNYLYAKNKSKPFDWLGKTIPSELPSEHPYCKYICNIQALKSIKKHEQNIIEIQKDGAKMKFLYNATTSIMDIKAKIEKLKLQLIS